MRKLFTLFSVTTAVITLSFLSAGVSSCEKKVIERDTVIVKDTVVIKDSTAWQKAGAHINDGLWAYYPINGSAVDSSGNNHELVLKGTAKFSHDMWGNKEGAIDFNGTGAYAEIADGKDFNSPTFTISFFQLTRKPSGLLFGKQNYTTGLGASFNVGFDLVYQQDLFRFAITKNQGEICNTIAQDSYKSIQETPLTNYAWYHIVAQFDGNRMKMYMNDVLVDSLTIDGKTLNHCTESSFILGAWWKNDPKFFDGKIDRLRIYTRALKRDEITYLYKSSSVYL